MHPDRSHLFHRGLRRKFGLQISDEELELLNDKGFLRRYENDTEVQVGVLEEADEFIEGLRQIQKTEEESKTRNALISNLTQEQELDLEIANEAARMPEVAYFRNTYHIDDQDVSGPDIFKQIDDWAKTAGLDRAQRGLFFSSNIFIDQIRYSPEWKKLLNLLRKSESVMRDFAVLIWILMEKYPWSVLAASVFVVGGYVPATKRVRLYSDPISTSSIRMVVDIAATPNEVRVGNKELKCALDGIRPGLNARQTKLFEFLWMSPFKSRMEQYRLWEANEEVLQKKWSYGEISNFHRDIRRILSVYPEHRSQLRLLEPKEVDNKKNVERKQTIVKILNSMPIPELPSIT